MLFTCKFLIMFVLFCFFASALCVFYILIRIYNYNCDMILKSTHNYKKNKCVLSVFNSTLGCEMLVHPINLF